jgi:hypothetical protein
VPHLPHTVLVKTLLEANAALFRRKPQKNKNRFFDQALKKNR